MHHKPTFSYNKTVVAGDAAKAVLFVLPPVFLLQGDAYSFWYISGIVGAIIAVLTILEVIYTEVIPAFNNKAAIKVNHKYLKDNIGGHVIKWDNIEQIHLYDDNRIVIDLIQPKSFKLRRRMLFWKKKPVLKSTVEIPLYLIKGKSSAIYDELFDYWDNVTARKETAA